MKTFSVCLCIALALWLVGCLSNAGQPIPETSVSSLATIKFTITPTFLPPSITPTLTPIPTQLPPTQTSHPTLTSDEAKTKLFNLLLNNGGCNLPCFLGYSPRLSTREDIQGFFSQFRIRDTPDMSISRPVANNRSIIGFYIRNNDSYFNIGVSTYEDKGQIEILGMGTFSQPKWDIHYAEVMKYYMLPQILKIYGKPSQVLVLTFRDDRQRPDITTNEFFLVLLYSEQGIYVKYKMERQTTGNGFLGCPSRSFVDVAVWSPEGKDTFSKVVQVMNSGSDLSSYKSIDDATSMTIDDFYQTFSNAENKSCIETAIATWPNP